MPKKLTIKEIQNFILENDKDNSCTLLSTEYKNSTTPLEFLCNKCDSHFERDWAHLKRGRFTCQNCANKSQHRNKFTIQDVQNFINQNDINQECLLLSTEYINNSSPLKLRCNLCGRDFERDFAHIQRGRFRCPECGIVAGAKKLVYTQEDVDGKIGESGYTRVSPYINASTPFEVVCGRGHNTSLVFSHYLCGHSGCKKCADIERTGPGSPNWKGGENEVINTLRKGLSEWKKQVLKRDNYHCVISNSKEDLVIHHIIGFNQLVSKASEKSGIPVLYKIKDYENIEDFYKLQETLITLHETDNGVTLTRQIHNEFHKIYGKGNNNREQFEEFLLNYQ